MNRKISGLFLLMMALFSAFSAFSQDCGFYPVRKGSVCAYQSLDGKGKITGSSRVTLLDVKQAGNTVVYNVRAEFRDDKEKALPVREYAMKCENGQFSVDMQSMVDPKSLEGFKDMQLSFTGNDISYPSALSAGQVLPDASITIAAASGGMSLMKMTVSITNRKVVGTESVTVPAGTFECFRITYDMETKFGFKMQNSATEWLNKGAGLVKTETLDKKGKLLGSRILTELSN